jgi:hypothetical protein
VHPPLGERHHLIAHLDQPLDLDADQRMLLGRFAGLPLRRLGAALQPAGRLELNVRRHQAKDRLGVALVVGVDKASHERGVVRHRRATIVLAVNA